MAQMTMYPVKDGSPQTTTSATLSDSATEVSVTELACFPAVGTEGANLITFWDDTTYETCEYTAKSSASGIGTLTIVRTGARHSSTSGGGIEWPAGTKCARTGTRYDFTAYKNNIEDLAATKQPLDATLTALAGVTTAAGKYPYFTGSDTAGVLDLPSGYNYIINPCFEVNQEGKASATGYWEYVVDQWFINADGGGDIVVSQQSFTVGQTDVPGEPKNYLRGVVSSASGVTCRSCIYQAIEGVRTLAGKTVTLSFYAKADAVKSISTELLQIMGAGGTPSSDVLGIGSHKFTLSTGWQKFFVTATIPNLTGKTLGTSGTDALWLTFWLSAGSNHNARSDSLGLQTGTFEIANVKLEEGTVATPFIVPRFDDELRKCQRFWQKSNPYSVAPGTPDYTTSPDGSIPIAVTAGQTVFSPNFQLEMRAAPTVVLYDYLGNQGKVTLYDHTNSVSPRTNDISPSYGGAIGISPVRFAVVYDGAVSRTMIELSYTANARL